MDVLRGFALFGILLMNIEWFTSPMVGRADGIDPGLHGLARGLDALTYVFASGKFWTLFSLLFGMGFAVMQARADAAGRPFVPVYLRRTVGLLVIGLAHAWLLWAGDILVAYALAALLLMAFARAPVAGLWAGGAALYLSIAGLMALSALVAGAPGGWADNPERLRDATEQLALQAAEIRAYGAGSYAEATAFRLRFFVEYLPSGVLFMLPMALGMFLVGAGLVRSGAMADPVAHRALFRTLAFVCGPAGLLLTIVGLAIDPQPDMHGADIASALWAMTLHMIGAPLMSLGYVGLVVLAPRRGHAGLAVLAPAGRMALTLYLMQSLVCTWVFYGYGLGLWGTMGRVAQVVLVLAIFCAQLAFAHAWMARFRLGPVEWLWRAFTYLRWPPMRHVPPSHSVRP